MNEGSDYYCRERLTQHPPSADPLPYGLRIYQNATILWSGVEAEGSSLHDFMTCGATWLYYERMIGALSDHADSAMFDEQGKEYTFASMQYICRNGGDKKTASACIAMFCLFGLVEKRASNWYLDPNIDSPSFMAKGHRERAPTPYKQGIMWYHVPEYTPELLQRAEQYAAIWQESGHTRKAISKATLIRLYGYEDADRAYGYNAVKLSKRSKEAERRIRAEAEKLIKASGYFYPQQLLSICIRQLEAEAQAEAAAVNKTWTSIKAPLMQENGWKYSKPSKAEKEKYSLANDRWIIRPNAA